jgi:hypothetical protein
MSDAKQKSPPGFSTRCKAVQIDPGDEAPLPVLLLRPWIRIEQIDLVDRSLPAASRAAPSHRRHRRGYSLPRVLDAADQLRHGIDEGLDADETGLRLLHRAMNEMFPATEADLETHASRPERGTGISAGRHGAARSTFNSGRTVSIRCDLLLAQRLALAPTEESLGRPCPAFLFRHSDQALIASLSGLTRSSFSQEKEPSRPALRPKWP